tara:strand:+ start:13045 stop:14235 length:1191 start_codon:yes stop_codon:yes gene_type:complete
MPADWDPWLTFAIVVVGVALLVVVIVALVTLPLRFISKRAGWDPRNLGRIRRPFRALLLAIALLIMTAFMPLGDEWETLRGWIEHGLLIAIIACAGWFTAGVIGFLFARTLARYPVDVVDNRRARRVHTQVAILRRLAFVMVGIVTVGAILLTFEGVEAYGASLLASAGLVSVVAGIAAQSALSNVFAGLQLAFTDGIRVDDVVVVEGEWGRIEEITLTYIVVHIWDDRRLVLPSTYFTTTPFENWTRSGTQILGSVEFDLDWRVSPSAMRAELKRIVEADPLWDKRSAVLQITDATAGFVRVRITVTAANSGALWDLRCNIREAMVEWLQAKSPAGVPRTRVEMVEAPKRAVRSKPGEEHSGMFSGSAEGDERQQSYTQSMPIVRSEGPPSPTKE